MIDLLGFAMALQFKPDGRGGWLYRKDQVGPAFPATRAERDRYVRWHGWMTLLSLPLMFAAVVLLAVIVDAVLGDDPDLSVPATFVIAGMPLALVYLFIKITSHAPARAFADRATVGAPVTRKQAFGHLLGRMTDRRILTTFFGLVIVMAISALRLPKDPQLLWLVIGLPAVVCLGFRWWRHRIENS